MSLLGTALVGAGVGFLGGLLGKGGSAIATPVLHALGVPSMIAVASPLPATIPSTLVAGSAYSRAGHLDRRVAGWVTAVGLPATAIGALLSRWVGGGSLVVATDVILVLLGLRLLSRQHPDVPGAGDEDTVPSVSWPRLVAVGTLVGLLSGLLANSGGFLLAPLFLTVLRLPIARALGTSLAVASALAVPGTVVHAWLGHIDWALVATLAITSVPLSLVGARLALRTDPQRLERGYGAALVVLGVVFLVGR